MKSFLKLEASWGSLRGGDGAQLVNSGVLETMQTFPSSRAAGVVEIFRFLCPWVFAAVGMGGVLA